MTSSTDSTEFILGIFTYSCENGTPGIAFERKLAFYIFSKIEIFKAKETRHGIDNL